MTTKKTTTIRGFAIDPIPEPPAGVIAGAEVRIVHGSGDYGSKATTDANGQFEFQLSAEETNQIFDGRPTARFRVALFEDGELSGYASFPTTLGRLETFPVSLAPWEWDPVSTEVVIPDEPRLVIVGVPIHVDGTWQDPITEFFARLVKLELDGTSTVVGEPVKIRALSPGFRLVVSPQSTTLGETFQIEVFHDDGVTVSVVGRSAAVCRLGASNEIDVLVDEPGQPVPASTTSESLPSLYEQNQQIAAFVEAAYTGLSFAGLEDDKLEALACSGIGGSLDELKALRDAKAEAAAHSLDEAAVYALRVSNASSSLRDLAAADQAEIEAQLQRAIDDGYLRTEDLDSGTGGISGAAGDIKNMRVNLAFPPGDELSTKLGQILLSSGLSTTDVKTFLDAWDANTADVPTFWSNLETTYGAGGDVKVARLKFTLFIGQVAGGHMPMVDYLQTLWGTTFNSYRDVAKYSEANWVTAIATNFPSTSPIGSPDEVAGDNATERDANYAKAMHRLVEALLPTEAVVYQLRAELAAAPFTADAETFVTDNEDFRLASTVLEKDTGYWTSANSVPAGGAGDALLNDLHLIQRRYNISPEVGRVQVVKALGIAAIDSALEVTILGRSGFRRRMSTTSLTTAQVDDIYLRAESVASTVYVQETADPVNQEQTPPEFLGLRAVLGAQDYCGCIHCRSIFSPSAYMAELLQWLSDRPQVSGPGTAFSELDNRRADIAKIKLSCENANTPLPLIDVVNEVLEAKVLDVHDGSDPSYGDPQTTLTAEELALEPENLDPTVYDTVLAASSSGPYHPWILPISLGLETARVNLEHLGVERAELIARYSRFYDGTPPTYLPGTPNWAAAYAAQLYEEAGLSGAQAQLIIEASTVVATPPEAENLWGYATAAPNWLDGLRKVPELMQRAELSFEEVETLLEVFPLAGPHWSTLPAEYVHWKILHKETTACSLDTAFIERVDDQSDPGYPLDPYVPDTVPPGWTSDLVVALQSFIRVSRATGLTFRQLDGLHRASGIGIDPTASHDTAKWANFVEFVASCLALHRAHPSLSLEEVSTWLGDLDVVAWEDDVPSFYERVVRSRSMPAVYAPDAIIDNTTVLYSADLGALASVLNATEAAATAALELLFASGTGELVTVATLSALYRVASIARVTGFELQEFCRLIEISGVLGTVPTGAPSTRAEVEALLELGQTVAGSGWSVAELDYFATGADRQSFEPTAPEQATQVVALIQALRSAFGEFEARVPTDDSAVLRARKLAEMAVEPVLWSNALVWLEGEPSDSYDPWSLFGTDPDLRNGCRADLPFIVGTPDETAILDILITTGRTEENQNTVSGLIESTALAYLRQDLEDRTIKSTIGEIFGLEPQLVESTLAAKLAGDADAGLKIIRDAQLADADRYVEPGDLAVLSDETAASDFIDTRAGVSTVAPWLEKARRVAAFVTAADLEPAVAAWLLDQRESATLEAGLAAEATDLQELAKSSSLDPSTFDRIVWTRRLVEFVGSLPASGATTGVQLLDALNGGNNYAAIRTGLAEALGVLTGHGESTWGVVLPVAEPSEGIYDLEFIRDGYAFLKQASAWDVAPSLLAGWAAGSNDAEATVTMEQAEEISATARAKHGERAWAKIGKQIQDRLRERRRDAMVAYLLNQPFAAGNDDEAFVDQFLIDVQTSACTQTSRIRAALSSVQMFIQRVFLQLENSTIFNEEDADDWSWMKRYRVWEANRKIFLYPENWTTPDLRDDKSELFDEFASAISQAELNDETVERAFTQYIEGVESLSSVQIIGVYHELEYAGVGDQRVTLQDRLHVFAREPGDGGNVYYRAWVDQSYWTPWEAASVGVSSGTVLPLVMNRRLFVFWPSVEERPGGSTTGGDDSSFLQVRLNWAERRSDGWSGGNVSRQYVTSRRFEGTSPRNRDDFDTFYAKAGEGDFPEIYLTSTDPNSERDLVIKVRALLVDGNSKARYYELGQFEVGGCTSLLEAVPNPYSASFDAHSPLGTFNAAAVGPKDLWPFGQAFRIIEPPSDGTADLAFRRRWLSLNDWAPYRTLMDWRVRGTRGTVIGPRQDDRSTGEHPFFVQGRDGVLFGHRVGDVISDLAINPGGMPETDSILASKALAPVTSDPTVAQIIWPTPKEAAGRYRMQTFFHPFGCLMLRTLRRHGVDMLLSPTAEDGSEVEGLVRQAESIDIMEGASAIYNPGTDLQRPYPVHNFDFSFGGSQSVYNWEIFFHMPMLVAERYMAEFKFAEAQRWMHYIFDPSRVYRSDTDGSQSWWRVKPLAEAEGTESSKALFDALSYVGNDPDKLAQRREADAQMEYWRDNPFAPHAVARMRPQAYQRYVVMRYLDLLIGWGDYLFAQDTIETNNEALTYYLLAQKLLGRRPVGLPGDDQVDQSFTDLGSDPDEAVLKAENYALAPEAKESFADTDTLIRWAESDTTGVPQPMARRARMGASFNPSYAAGPTPYFCVPPNEKMLAYWDTVADRLFKLRNCMNLEGVERQLALYEPPIDPGLLARAYAAGLDVAAVASGAGAAALPGYRFGTMVSLAQRVAGEVRQLGQQLLAAIEKGDAEEMAQLRGGHAVRMSELTLDVASKEIESLEAQITALRAQQEIARERFVHFAFLLTNGELAEEIDARENRKAANLYRKSAARDRRFGKALALLPDNGFPLVGFFGGQHLANFAEFMASSNDLEALRLDGLAFRQEVDAGFRRRGQQWELEKGQAQLTAISIEKEILATEIRLELAKLRLRNQKRQLRHDEEALEFMQSKFSNQELYHWMSTELSRFYFQSYKLAVDVARRAERCMRHELSDESLSFIGFSHWEGRRKGLLAGDRLIQDINRMEVAYHERNRRELEVSRRVSLSLLDATALVELRKNGTAEFMVPEWLYDLDYPGLYNRRIKSVSVAVMSTSGPYATTGVKLTHLDSKIRKSKDASGTYDEQTAGSETRFTYIRNRIESIVTSSGRDSNGMFEGSSGDGRYLPFEGAGAISRWRVELPGSTELRSYDPATISDIVVTINYTARDGGKPLRDAAIGRTDEIIAAYSAPVGGGVQMLFRSAGEFSDAWNQFLYSEATGTRSLSLDFSSARVPYVFAGRGNGTSIDVRRVVAIIVPSDTMLPTLETNNTPTAATGTTVTPAGQAAVAATGKWSVASGYLVADWDFTGGLQDLGAWSLEIGQADFAESGTALNLLTETIPGQTDLRLDPTKVRDILFVVEYALPTP